MVAKKRHIFGERCSYAKLSDSLVRQIFAEYAAGNGYTTVAQKMGLREKAIMGIIQRTRWKHVEIDPAVLQQVARIRSERAAKYYRAVAA